MRSEPRYIFQSFQFDPANAQLWRGQKEIVIRRKTFEVLRYLVDHPGQIVTKTALLDEVWTTVAVSDSMPAICVSELRKALGDDANNPRFIETVPRRGYRFVAKVTIAPALAQVTKRRRAPAVPGPLMVGRDAELAQLRNCFAGVRSGARRVMFIAGEAGIGKTTFVNSFIDSLRREGIASISERSSQTHYFGRASQTPPPPLLSVHPARSACVARGQCIEQYGAGEPYMPVLEALTRLGQEPGGEWLVDILRRLAPTWLAQMLALITVEERARLPAGTQAVTQQPRMLREMAQALEALSAESPLVLLLEDLHWSDFSTLELIAAVARRSEPARLLILGTYRPVDMLAGIHALRTMKEELEIHQQCQELRLSLLSEKDVADYLGLRFSGDDSQQFGSLAPAIHERTEGNPLFMVNVVDYLVAQGPQLDTSKLETPRNIRQMIERNLERLTAEEQSVLEGASVAGAEFSAAAVAAALERPVSEVEACCTRLSRQERFVSAQGMNEWPDGTVASSFRFHHALYRDVLYDRVPAGHRVELHRRIAVREECAYAQRAVEIASELAHHYRNANDKDKAIEYLAIAGQQAIQRSAHADAIGSLRAALELLQSFPEGPERMRRELPLQLTLGPTLIPVEGWAAAEVESAYIRARELCERLGDPPAELFLALCGLWAVCCLRGELVAAYDFAEQLMHLAQNAHIPRLLMVARSLLGNTLFSMGELPRAREQFEEAIALYNLDDLERRRELAHKFPVSDQGVSILSHDAAVLWSLGYPDQALKRSDEALTLARALAHPHSVTLAQEWGANLRVCLRETRSAQETTKSTIALSAEHGFTDLLAGAVGYSGWALTQEGRSEEGIALMEESLAASRAKRMELGRPSLLCLLAEAFICAGRLDDGSRALREAEAAAEREEREREPEIHRLKGELLLKRDDFSAEEARSCFQRAIDIARKQSAKSWELRATMSLARLLVKQGRREEARTMLADIYHWFSEGFDTADLKEARALLEELSR